MRLAVQQMQLRLTLLIPDFCVLARCYNRSRSSLKRFLNSWRSLIMERRSFLKKAGVGLAAGVVAAPAIAQNAALPNIKWRMASSFPKSLDTLHGSAEFLVKRISDMTGGKFQIQLFAAGELVPPAGVHDAVKDNTVEIGYTCSYY